MCEVIITKFLIFIYKKRDCDIIMVSMCGKKKTVFCFSVHWNNQDLDEG